MKIEYTDCVSELNLNLSDQFLFLLENSKHLQFLKGLLDLGLHASLLLTGKRASMKVEVTTPLSAASSHLQTWTECPDHDFPQISS